MKRISDTLPGKADGTTWRNRIVGEGVESPDQLLANPSNWRIHPKFQQDVLSSVLDEVGWIQEVIVNQTTGFILDGHLRVTLAMRHGEKTIPVKYVELTLEEEALILATLDPLAGLAVADDAKLRELHEQIKSDDAAIQAMMDRIKEDAGIVEEEEKADDPGGQVDRAEELQEKWQVKPGDIWRMGDHLVICGDCREPETWARLLEAAGADKVNGVFTSPPYAEQRKKQYGGTPTGEYVEWWEAVQANVRASLADDGSFFVNIKPHCEKGQRVLYVFDLVLAMARRWGWRFVDELCWTHQGYPGKWDNRFKNQFESIYHFSANKRIVLNHESVTRSFSEKSGELSVYNGIDDAPNKAKSGFKQSHKKSAVFDGALPGNVMAISLGATATDSGTYQAATFPVKLPSFFIRAYSDEQDAWCDPFLGSGTTIIAAHQNSRCGLGIERLEKYVAVTLQRYQDLTGIEPALLSNG